VLLASILFRYATFCREGVEFFAIHYSRRPGHTFEVQNESEGQLLGHVSEAER
jgi:hypothetical protein